KRRHLARDVVRFCDEARRRRPDVVFGADLIAGFPTESEAAHEASLRLIERAGLTYLHIFPYSARAGTPAARMPQLEKAVIKDRAARLRAAGARALVKHLDTHIGRETEVLVERATHGRLPDFTPVEIAGVSEQAGRPVRARIIGHDETRLKAQAL
ncbi:MAG: tRNA (N(6)-L-threonylcarbamoyladenosine(37)-C(2))-methylthiotransferase MtaB, partial [Pseudomonadota bacterium]|nr:tRNA (N(6)-L-threonylcarbamoyladenosine(37)-C(2))-methylthiotransferase MtaB [Pseudomonadota bacterium]